MVYRGSHEDPVPRKVLVIVNGQIHQSQSHIYEMTIIEALTKNRNKHSKTKCARERRKDHEKKNIKDME